MQTDHWHDVRGLTRMGITGFGIKDSKLRVAFGPKLYQYETDAENLCCTWVQTQSIGSFFHSEIKPLPTVRIR